MHRNSKEPGNNFYKTTNSQTVQINATTGELRFQTQNRNNLIVENNAYNAYKDIKLSQTQSEGPLNEETQQHRVIENRSIITIENQLIEFHQKQLEKFKQIKKLIYHLIGMKTFQNGVEISLSQFVIQCCLTLMKEEFQKKIERSKLKAFLEL